MPDAALYGAIPETPARILTDAEVEAMEALRGSGGPCVPVKPQEEKEPDDRRPR